MRLSAALLFLLLGCMALRADAGPLVWHDGIEEGRAEATRTGKLLLIHFWSTQCGPCAQLEQKVYSQNRVAQSIERHFVAVKINTEVHPELARRYAIRFVPTDVVMDAEGRVLATQKCPPEPTRYLAGLMRLVPPSAGLPTQSAVVAPPVAPPVTAPAAYQGMVGPRYGSNAAAYMAPQPPPQAVAAPQGPTAGLDPRVLGRPAPMTPAPLAAESASQNAYVLQRGAPRSQVAGFSPQQVRPPSLSPASPRVAPLPPSTQDPGLDGMCPVELMERKKWVGGNRNWGAYHRGRLYLFAGEHQQQRFLANPDYYSPVLSGYDPVIALQEGRLIAGHRKHGVFYQNRVYLFDSEANLNRFSQAPADFAVTDSKR